MSLIINTNLGRLYLIQRRFDEAERQFQKTLEIDPNFGIAQRRLADLYDARGQYDKAMAEYAKAFPSETERVRQAYAERGVKGYWQARLEILERWRKQQYVVPTLFAIAYAHLGEKDKAFQELQRAVDEHSYEIDWLADPNFDLLRHDPRFKEIARQANVVVTE